MPSPRPLLRVSALVALLCFSPLSSLQAQPPAATSTAKPAASALPKTSYGEPSKAQLTAFQGSKADPPAKELLGVNEDYAGRSYLAGDEWHLELYQPHIDKLGGGYVGVGSDQGYLLMSWSMPEFGWLVDYDPLVVVTHKIYHAFFLEAASPAEFLALWDSSGKERGEAILAKYWENDEHYGQIKNIYRDLRVRIQRRLKRVKKSTDEAKTPCYLNDQARYDHVRGMIATGRVRPMLANLLDDEGLVGIGAAAKQMNVPIRVLYLSNAQEYWNYPQQFRDNIAALPFDERSVVLHTLSTWSTNKDYRYVLQPALNYADWMTAGWVRKVYHMIPRRKLEGEEDIDFIHFTRPLADAEAKRSKKKKK